MEAFKKIKHMFIVGIPSSDTCHLKWDSGGEVEMGFSNVRCGWQWRHRYPRDDQNSTGK